MNNTTSHPKNTGFSAIAVLFTLVLSGAFFFSMAPVLAATPAEEGSTIFEQKCISCHTVGGGRGIGPDLQGITGLRDRTWLISFITAPDVLVAQNDPIAKQLLQEYGFAMPNLGVSEDEAASILAYLEPPSLNPPADVPTTTPQPALISQPEIPPSSPTANADSGKSLYTGATAFTNGGPACISCHDVSNVGLLGGGTVGKDLTVAYTTFGEAAMVSILKTTPFPMMKEIYAARPLTDAEIVGLTAFLKETASTPASQAQNSALFIVIGVAAAALIIGLFQLFWRKRLAGVRRPLVKGGSK